MAHIIFVQEMFFPLQSTMALSAYLKKGGHTTDVAIGSPSEIVKYVEENKADLVAFSVLTSYRNHMLATVDAIKEANLNIPLMAGGYDITFMPQILENSNLDVICKGEGGDPMVEFCNALDKKKDWRNLKIGNLHIKNKKGVVNKNPMRYWLMDMDAAPFEDRDIYWDKDPYFRIVPFTQVLAGRGCPYPCTYCFNAGYKKIHEDAGMNGKEYTNLRSVGHVIRELKMLSKKYEARDFFFNDSTLTYNKEWIVDFCKAYKKSKLKQTFSINVVIPEMNEDVCKALADTKKCRLVRFGLETGNEEFRYRTLRKSIKNDDLIKVTDRMNEYGLRYSMQMMLGLPGETQEYAMETLDVARRLTGKTGVHGINIFKPFPGLEINNVGLELGQYKATDVMAPGSVAPPTWRKTGTDNENVESNTNNKEASKTTSKQIPPEIAARNKAASEINENAKDAADDKKKYDDLFIPADEAYLTSRSVMHKTGINENQHNSGYNHGKNVFGSKEMVFYDNYRRDKLGLYILKLSRYSHVLIRFPGLKKAVDKLMELPDNKFNRIVWKITEGLLNIRVHAGAPWSYFIKYAIFHAGKQVR